MTANYLNYYCVTIKLIINAQHIVHHPVFVLNQYFMNQSFYCNVLNHIKTNCCITYYLTEKKHPLILKSRKLEKNIQ